MIGIKCLCFGALVNFVQGGIRSGFLILLSTTCALAQLAPSAPNYQPKALTEEQIPDNSKAIAPYVAMARKSYPEARQRFLSGLPRGQNFFKADADHRQEQVERVSSAAIASVASRTTCGHQWC
jgi:hypothetical protein